LEHANDYKMHSIPSTKLTFLHSKSMSLTVYSHI
jgi:hypothetical protein